MSKRFGRKKRREMQKRIDFLEGWVETMIACNAVLAYKPPQKFKDGGMPIGGFKSGGSE